jgi:hypothetical protein
MAALTSITAHRGAQMSNWFEAALIKYGWIWIGLTVGFAAKYALLIKRGIPVKPRLVFADLLLLPMVSLIAYQIATQIGLQSERAALVACFCTVGADRLVKLLTERFWRQIEAATLRDVASDVISSKGELRQAVQIAESAKAVVAREYQPDRLA